MKKEFTTSPRTIFDELFAGTMILMAGSVFIGKLINPPLGNILLVGCALYVFSALLVGFTSLFYLTFSRIDAENKKTAENEEKTEQAEDSKGYLIYFAIAYIVFWIVMFLIFPEGSSVGEFIRQWKHFG